VRPLAAVAGLALCLAIPAAAETAVIYSRADHDAARKVQALASVYDRSVIDRSVQPGAHWRQAMAGAICGAGRVLLVWSRHAADSAEVRREIDTALVCRVAVVPVLLDSTPLPGLVADVQAVDWR
jgi:hypothetical protein